MAHVCIGPSRPCVLTVLEYISWFAWFHHLLACAHITFGPWRSRGPQRVRGDVSSVDRVIATTGFIARGTGTRYMNAGP